MEKIRVRAEIWGTDMDRFVLRHPFVEIDGVLVDLEAFSPPAGCEMCGNCCTWGARVPAERAQKLLPHLAEITGRYLPAHRSEKAGWSYSPAWDTEYTNIVETGPGKKACGFLYEKEGRHMCAIHSWAADTGRDPLDYLPFECFMFPVAILPYDGILHPGKQLLTVRTERNNALVTVYGPGPSLRRSLLRRLTHEIGEWVRRRTASLRPGKDINEECYFRNTPGIRKDPAFVYFGGAISWYFGKEFHEKLSAEVKQFISGAPLRPSPP